MLRKMALSGELALRSLPAVLLDLHDERVTGKLTLKRGRVSKTVDLVNGDPVAAASTSREETLGHFLVSTGMITEEEHRHAVTHATEFGGKFGAALVALQMLTPKQLVEQLAKQTRHKLVQALRWPQGAWRFDPSREVIEGVQLAMIEVVLSGLRETVIGDLHQLAEGGTLLGGEKPEQHLRVLAHHEMGQQRHALAERRQVVERAHRHVDLVADAADVDQQLRRVLRRQQA